MVNKNITLLDYGMANLLNVARAFEYCGATVRVIEGPKEVVSADRLVVPGVGAFADVIREKKERNQQKNQQTHEKISGREQKE